MQIKLRPYQQKFINDIYKEISINNRIVAQLPTGGGKTICFSYLAQSEISKGNSVLICSDRIEITSQNGATLSKFDLDPEFITPKQRTIPYGVMCAVGMLQTIQRRLADPEWLEFFQSFHLVIIDEAHTQSGNALIQALRPDQKLIGITATPIRSSGQRQLGMDYLSIIKGVSTKTLIESNHLVPCDHYTIDAPDLSSVDYSNSTGDFNVTQMAKVFEHKTKYEGVVKEWFRLTPNTSTIVFCASSEQAINITQEFTERGVKAKYILSGTFDSDSTYSGTRSNLIDELNSGELTVLVNVGIAVAGLDVPRLETCITAYATTSLSKWLQSLGRCSRPFPNKQKFTLLDFGGNVSRLGFYEQDREWGLWYESSRNGSKVAPVKECPEEKKDTKGKIGCGALIPLTLKECPFCGYYFANEREIYEAELQLLTQTDKDEDIDLETWIARRIQKGWSNQRILMTMCLKHCDNPKSAFLETIPYLRTKEGKAISPYYWKQFKERVLRNKAEEKYEAEKKKDKKYFDF